MGKLLLLLLPPSCSAQVAGVVPTSVLGQGLEQKLLSNCRSKQVGCVQEVQLELTAMNCVSKLLTLSLACRDINNWGWQLLPAGLTGVSARMATKGCLSRASAEGRSEGSRCTNKT
jgi:hypothetical protein